MVIEDSKSDPTSFKIIVEKKKYKLKAETETLKTEWVDSLNKAINE